MIMISFFLFISVLIAGITSLLTIVLDPPLAAIPWIAGVVGGIIMSVLTIVGEYLEKEDDSLKGDIK